MFRITPIVKNLLIINVVMFVIPSFVLPVIHSSGLMAEIAIQQFDQYFGLHFFLSDRFLPTQILTYAFLHQNFNHLLYNMIGLVMIGPLMESVLGAKKFLWYYLGTAIGAALVYCIAQAIEIVPFVHHARTMLEIGFDPADLRLLYHEFDANGTQFLSVIDDFENFPTEEFSRLRAMSLIRSLMNAKIEQHLLMGASGSVFGLLFGLTYMYPNREVTLFFIPIPVRLVVIVGIFVVIEIYSAFLNSAGDNVSHTTHIGGVLTGLLIMRFWKIKSRYY
jgi:membrane associated rhomboid family serine protease